MNKNSKILITGAGGFLGHHVVKIFRQDGYTNLYTPPSITLDLLEDQCVTDYFYKYKPEYVIHLAGVVGGIGLNKERPADLTLENLQMGLNVIRACHKFSTKKLLMTGTVCSMASEAQVPFEEEDFIFFNRHGPGMPEITNSGYGLAKRMLYEVLVNYNKQYGLKFNYLIPVNMLGEHDHFNISSSHVIPAMIVKFFEAKVEKRDSVSLWGTGNPTREFLYAGDCAIAIKTALENYEGTYPLLIGTGQEISIQELAEKIKKLIGFIGRINWDTNKPDGQTRRCLNVSKAKELLGFEARTSLDEALEKTVSWFCKTKLVSNV